MGYTGHVVLFQFPCWVRDQSSSKNGKSGTFTSPIWNPFLPNLSMLSHIRWTERQPWTRVTWAQSQPWCWWRGWGIFRSHWQSGYQGHVGEPGDPEIKSLTPLNYLLNSPCPALAGAGPGPAEKGPLVRAQEVAPRAGSSWLLMKPRTTCALTDGDTQGDNRARGNKSGFQSRAY